MNYNLDQLNNKLTVFQKGNITIIDLKDILYLQCSGNLTYIHLCIDQYPITVSKLLLRFEEELSQYGFIRVNRNTLVNITKIRELRKTKKNHIILVNGEILAVSRRNYYKIQRTYREK